MRPDILMKASRTPRGIEGTISFPKQRGQRRCPDSRLIGLSTSTLTGKSSMGRSGLAFRQGEAETIVGYPRSNRYALLGLVCRQAGGRCGCILGPAAGDLRDIPAGNQ